VNPPEPADAALAPKHAAFEEELEEELAEANELLNGVVAGTRDFLEAHGPADTFARLRASAAEFDTAHGRDYEARMRLLAAAIVRLAQLGEKLDPK
jgi:hypothetical protein